MFSSTLAELVAAAFAFVGGHFLLSARPLRARLVARLGERGFLALFSVLAALTLGWMLSSYGNAPTSILWAQTTWARWLPLLVMPVALVLVVAALRPDNPTLVGADGRWTGERPGIFAVTRHPMMWGITLWAAAHIPANGDSASLVFFGALLALASLGTVAMDAKARADQPGWEDLAARTSNLPFAALAAGRTEFRWRDLGWLPVAGGITLYALVLALHGWLFGVQPWP